MTGASAHSAPRARGRRTLLGVAALFLVPLALSFALYYGSAWRPSGRTNHGELLAPAGPLPGDLPAFRGKWSLVAVGGVPCDARCRQVLQTTRQARLALANDMGRVQRVWVVTGPCCDRAEAEPAPEPQAGLVIIEARGTQAAPLVSALSAPAALPAVYVVDPLGNLVLRYDARQGPRGLLEDLQKLLRVSQIG